MKKLLAFLLALILLVSLCACGSNGDDEEKDPQAEKYEEACDLYDEGEYAEAKELFEELGDYEDSKEMVVECEHGEIEAELQGTWKNSAFASAKMYTYNTFKNGRMDVSLTIDGEESFTNEGDYRIDFEKQEIYVCYDYTYSLSTSGETTKKENTEEKMLFTYTFEDGEMSLFDSSNNKLDKES